MKLPLPIAPSVLLACATLHASPPPSPQSAPSKEKRFSSEELEGVRKPLEDALRLLKPVAELEQPVRGLEKSMQSMGEGLYQIMDALERELSSVPPEKLTKEQLRELEEIRRQKREMRSVLDRSAENGIRAGVTRPPTTPRPMDSPGSGKQGEPSRAARE